MSEDKAAQDWDKRRFYKMPNPFCTATCPMDKAVQDLDRTKHN